VAYPCDESALRGSIEAAKAGIIVPVLVGPAQKIRAVAREHGLDISQYQIVDVASSEAAAAKAVELIRESKGELLMKGSLHTDELMREVTSSKTGLRTARRISHVFIMDVPGHAETLFITDAAINIAPDLDVKRDIVQNAVDLFTEVGLGEIDQVLGEHVAGFEIGHDEDLSATCNLGFDALDSCRLKIDGIVEGERPVEDRAGDLSPVRHLAEGGRVDGGGDLRGHRFDSGENRYSRRAKANLGE
jgi:hypothetical protein